MRKGPVVGWSRGAKEVGPAGLRERHRGSWAEIFTGTRNGAPSPWQVFVLDPQKAPESQVCLLETSHQLL